MAKTKDKRCRKDWPHAPHDWRATVVKGQVQVDSHGDKPPHHCPGIAEDDTASETEQP